MPLPEGLQSGGLKSSPTFEDPRTMVRDPWKENDGERPAKEEERDAAHADDESSSESEEEQEGEACDDFSD